MTDIVAHHPGRAGPRHPRRLPAACSSSRAARAPARPPSPCTAPPTCSTPTASGWRAAACSSSAPRPRSCATSPTCCPPSARPAWCSADARASCGPAVDAPATERPEVAAVKGRPAMADVLRPPSATGSGCRPARSSVDSTGARAVSAPGAAAARARRRAARPAAQRGRPLRPPGRRRPRAELAAGAGRESGGERPARRPRPGRPARGGRACRPCASGRPAVAAADRAAAASPTSSPGPTGWPRARERHPTPTRRSCCCASRRAPWTPADVPLLDEADELLGPDDALNGRRATGRGAARARTRDARPAARLALDRPRRRRGGETPPPATSRRRGARRAPGGGGDPRQHRPSGPRADRTWTFGHVVVDEAQELSPMAWRLLLRRCPTGR